MSFKEVREEVLDGIKEALACCEYKGTDKEEEFRDDISFWLDPDIVLYNSEVGSDEIEASSYDDLGIQGSWLELFLTEDIARTYLSTRDFALVISAEDIGDDCYLVVGAVDRSTGIALLNESNLLDPDTLAGNAKIAVSNTRSKGDLTPILRKYSLIIGAECSLPKQRVENSKRRLTALLSEIDQQVLSKFLGKEITAKEEL
jgi:hypothetical protein